MGLPAPDHNTSGHFRIGFTCSGFMDKILRDLNTQFKKYRISHINNETENFVGTSIADNLHTSNGSILTKKADGYGRIPLPT